MKKTIIKSFIWVMDAMVDGLCPWVRKSMEDRKPILLTAQNSPCCSLWSPKPSPADNEIL